MTKKLNIFSIVLILLIGQVSLFGQDIKMPFYYSDHMVLQRDAKVPIVGKAKPGSTVVISLTKAKRPLQLVKAKADKNGDFRGEFKPIKEGGPYALGIRDGRSYVEFNDVMIGDVWLCSGQSNMSFTLSQAKDGDLDIASSKENDLRLLMMTPKWITDDEAWDKGTLDALNKGDYWQSTSWELSDPSSSESFSAIGWYFGKILQESLDIPIGIICNAVDGAPTESFIDKLSLMTVCPDILDNDGVNSLVQPWINEREAKNLQNAANASSQVHPYKPTALYNLGISPIKDLAIKGVIWYQGESNTRNIPVHEKLLKGLVSSWRKAWGNEQMPFYMVQLSSMDKDFFAEFRDSQRKLSEEIPNSGIAVSSDYGDRTNIHPTEKEPVAERLSRLALHRTYGQDVEDMGPTPNNISVINILNGSKEIMISYKHANGLKTKYSEDEPGPFEISVDGGETWMKTSARIEGTNIVLSVPSGVNVPYDVKVRYAWQNFSEGNLYNSDGLPASTWKN